MIYTIENDKMKVSVNSHGAELMSIKNSEGREYLWQGDKKYWQDRAPILFPYIARLTDGKYYLDGKCYSMPIHGFASSSEFEVVEKNDLEITFSLKSNKETYLCYPRKFEFLITYKLVETTLNIIFNVINEDEKVMYFGVGGHPGFLIDGKFDEYYLEFETECEPIRVGFNDKCFLNGKDEKFPLVNNKILMLNHKLFDNDAIVLFDNAKTLTIKNNFDNYKLIVSYDKMKYLGLWHMPKTDAPYICIEPWSSLPSREGIIEELEKQNNLIKLEKGENYINAWSISICENK